MSSSVRQGGFTLIEIMVAVAIFALIGIASGQVLSRVLQANETARDRAERLFAVQRAVTLLERDLLQIVQRPIRDAYGDPRPALILQAGGQLEMTRQGWRNPLGIRRSELQRVAWHLDAEGVLRRSFWPVLDRAQDTEARDQVVLEGVDALEVELIDAEGTRWSYWPASGTVPLPGDGALDAPPLLAVTVQLELAPFGRIARLLPLPDDARDLAIGAADGDAGGRPDDGDGESGAVQEDGAGSGDSGPVEAGQPDVQR